MFKTLAILLTLFTLNIHSSVIFPNSKESMLTMYVFPSPRGLDWSKPSKLVKKLLGNYLAFGKNRKIGHVAVEVQCKQSGNNFMTGMTSKRMNAFKSLFIRRDGFYILWDYFEGELEKRGPLTKEIKEKFENGRIGSVSWLISEETCERLIQYEQEYRELGYERWYGLSNRPRYGEGAGCSAFGKSFVEVAGLYNQEYDEGWSYNIRFPWKLIGGPLTPHRVPFRRTLKRKTQWAKADEPHIPLKFWDPDKMMNWINKKARDYYQGLPVDYKVVRHYRTLHLLYDSRNVPTPNEPIWLD